MRPRPFIARRSAPLLLAATLAGAGGLASFMPRTARACSCLPPPPPTQAFEQADVVFEGRPFASSVDGNQARYSFEIDRFWKGDLDRRVEIETATSSAQCGRSYQVGTAYIVYGRRSPDGTLTDGLCSRTRTMMSAEDDIEVLGPGLRPSSSSAPPSGEGERDPMPREPPRIDGADRPAPPAVGPNKRGCAVEMPHAPFASLVAIGLLLTVAIGRRGRLR